MAMISSLWDTLLGKQKRTHKKDQHTVSRTKVAHQLKGNHNPVHLEKRKLVATRSQLESQANPKLDLDQLRARIDRQSDQYSQLRQRQQTSMSRWFGERTVGIDEAALTKRLAAPVQRFSQDQLDLNLNFSDIHLPDYYESSVIYLGTEVSTVPSGFELDLVENSEDLEDISDTADFSDIAADFADFADLVLMPPLVALSENVPELDDLLARLQIVEWLEAQAAAPEQDSAEEQEVHHAELHIVTPFETGVPAAKNSPVPLIKRHGKGKKGRRARSKEAAKIKNGTRN